MGYLQYRNRQNKQYELIPWAIKRNLAMNKKTDTLLQQIAENSRKSTVFIETGFVIELPFGYDEEWTEILTYIETASGFFVEPDKIVTTIDVLAEAAKIAAIPGNSLSQTVTNSAQLSGDSYELEIWEETGISIEGVAAFDAKTTLCY